MPGINSFGLQCPVIFCWSPEHTECTETKNHAYWETVCSSHCRLALRGERRSAKDVQRI